MGVEAQIVQKNLFPRLWARLWCLSKSTSWSKCSLQRRQQNRCDLRMCRFISRKRSTLSLQRGQFWETTSWWSLIICSSRDITDVKEAWHPSRLHDLCPRNECSDLTWLIRSATELICCLQKGQCLQYIAFDKVDLPSCTGEWLPAEIFSELDSSLELISSLSLASSDEVQSGSVSSIVTVSASSCVSIPVSASSGSLALFPTISELKKISTSSPFSFIIIITIL